MVAGLPTADWSIHGELLSCYVSANASTAYLDPRIDAIE
jgi:hypothetical protein